MKKSTGTPDGVCFSTLLSCAHTRRTRAPLIKFNGSTPPYLWILDQWTNSPHAQPHKEKEAAAKRRAMALTHTLNSTSLLPPALQVGIM